jgi:hypothetical protein
MTISLSEWPNEAQAAAMLGTSVKTIMRYADAGKIETQKRPRPGKKPENVCNPSDIERLMPKAHVMPAEVANGTAIARLPAEPAKTLDPAPVLAMIRAIATAIETERQIVQMPRLWLSLEEAAEYSGLSVHFLRDCIVEPEHYQPGQNLIGIRAGRRGSWRIQRASLEAFAG